MNRKKQIISLLIIFFLLMTNTVFFLRSGAELRQSRQELKKGRVLLHKMRCDYELIQQAWATSAISQMQRITLDPEKRIPAHGALVLRISEKHCSSCVDQLIFEIRKHLDPIGLENLIVLYSSDQEGPLNSKARQRLLFPATFVRFASNRNVTALDQFGLPYLFTINAGGEVLSSFLPYPVGEKYTEIFLKTIEKQFTAEDEN